MPTKLLLFTIALGLFLGLTLPTGKPAPQERAAIVATAAPSPAQPTPMNPVDTVIERKGDGHFYVDATVNGQLVHFLVDTGASMVALTKEDAQRVGLPFSPAEFEVIGRGASGDVKGKHVSLDRVAIGMKEAHAVPAAIVDDGLGISLLGQSFLSQVGSVTISNDRMTLR